MSGPGGSWEGRRVLVLWNPASGYKAGIRTNRGSLPVILDLLRRHSLGDELVVPASAQSAAMAAADAVQQGYDVVVAAGGDGTIGVVARQLLDSRTALGILPLGSVMNIPRMLGVPRDVEAAAGILADGQTRAIDVGRVGDHLFYEAGSIGLHAAATRELPKVDRGDYGALARSVISAVRYVPSPVRIELDGDRIIETTALMVAVANGPFLGPGVPVAPEALLDDGVFDVRVFLHDKKAKLAHDLASITTGHAPDPRHAITERARWVRIASPRPLPVRADSTNLGTTPAVFEVRPMALTVISPRGAPDHTAGAREVANGRSAPGDRDRRWASRIR